jgi:hypothetical protein
MKILVLLVLLFAFGETGAQVNEPSPYYKRVFEAKFMDKPPVFSFGKDSLQRFYFSHFPAFDTVLRKAIEKGDTAKYLRVYFSFNLDENGYAYDPRFERVASTRSSTTESAKTIKYFNDLKPLLDKAIQTMMVKMPAWKPGLQDGIPVKTANYDFLQFWVGLSAPQ